MLVLLILILIGNYDMLYDRRKRGIYEINLEQRIRQYSFHP